MNARRWWRRGLASLLPLALTGCAGHLGGPGYYWQSVTGHLALVRAARPVGDWLQDPATPALVRTRLRAAQAIRRFAVTELGLPDNSSYTRYADLGRRGAVYNVVAAAPFSLSLEQWCFPVTGCVGYRGYFNEASAKAYAATLDPSLETAVYPVPAYSTLGWTNWMGGDPLLNTFITYPEGELARLIFHELAHQQVYARNDTPFNESFATAVERLGGERWLHEQAGDAARDEFARFQERRLAFRALTRQTRDRLAAVYADGSLDDGARAARKQAVMDDFRARYAQLRDAWGGYTGYDRWVAAANNALFGAQAVYDQWVPAFEALFEREGKDFKRFYDAVRQLADATPAERLAALQALMPPPATTTPS
ncbi:MAG: aminopeptidase [Gammaproteobacteria bacterium]